MRVKLQAIWDCRFSSPGHRLTGVADHQQPEPAWVCARAGERRPVTDWECAACPRWEREAVTPCP
jgi:hypothetical protein